MFDCTEAFRPLRSHSKIGPVTSLLDVDKNVEVLHVTRNTAALDTLPGFATLRVLNASDIDEVQFRHICKASQITHLGANISEIISLDSLQNLVNLRVLELTDNTNMTTLSGIEALRKLEAFALGKR